jgi:16S rRNA (uracil1498-N3)-methyltransferase
VTTRHDPFFYTDPSLIGGSEVAIRGADARHLTLVRRARPGDSIRVSDGLGRVFDVRISAATDSEVVGEIVEEDEFVDPQPTVSVFQALAKGSKLDFVIQKVVEIGVNEIVIFKSARSVPEWDSARSEKALARWRSIAGEAAKQSRRPHLPRLEGLLTSDSAASMLHGVVLIADASAPKRLREALPEDVPKHVCVVVGPEGGLEDADTKVFRAAGGIGVSLGSQILRTETAALVAATAVMYEYDKIG